LFIWSRIFFAAVSLAYAVDQVLAGFGDLRQMALQGEHIFKAERLVPRAQPFIRLGK
jgi:hypothetical protein